MGPLYYSTHIASTAREKSNMHLKLPVFMIVVFAFALRESAGQYDGWEHSGLMYILTTPEGADLPATAVETDFPLLVRIHHDYFDFSEAHPRGNDIRFSAKGKALAYQIEKWDRNAGSAAIWVRIPRIKGDEQQAITMHWGNNSVADGSIGEEVFSTGKGFAAVWHLGDDLDDSTSNDLDGASQAGKPSTNTSGVIGDAQEFGRNKIVRVRTSSSANDRRVDCMPSGNADRTMSAWVRPASFESHNWAAATIGGWGEPEPGAKPQMGLSYFTFTGRGQPRFHLYGFDPRCESRLPLQEWRHVGLSISKGMVRFYIDGKLQRTINNQGAQVKELGVLRTPVSTRVDLGDHGNGRGPFNGSLDEVRFEAVARSHHWMKLCYENQKPMQTLVGPLIQPGAEFSVSETTLTLEEGRSVELSATAGGARKIYWTLQDEDDEKVLAVDRFNYTFDAGRLAGDKKFILKVKAVFDGGTLIRSIPVGIQERIPDPSYTLTVPQQWNGRDELRISPTITNQAEMRAQGAGKLNYSWKLSGMATISQEEAGTLVLQRAQNSGTLKIQLDVDNRGDTVSRVAEINVVEPQQDPWVDREPQTNEQPVDHQFFARDDKGEGTLHCRGTLPQPADAVFLKLYGDGQLLKTVRQEVTADRRFALSVKLKAGLITYRTEFGVLRGGKESTLKTASDLVCGDVFVIQGQSNAEAWTDERVVHPYRSPWLRSFGTPTTNKDRARDIVWGNALSFNGGEQHHHLQIGYWGVELGRLLIETHQIPICILNGAQGGTRVDQHQRNEENPTDVTTIYGRLLWRLQQAKLTHGVRAVLWHQGENDQGEAGAVGEFGWVNYQQYFVRMAAAWKQDFPNIKQYYIHQIWPGACGSRSIEGDRLREQQRQLPRQFSNMNIMSTLGIRPGGGCHFLPDGYAAMARQLFPLVNQRSYGVNPEMSATAPNVVKVCYTNANRLEIQITFDQTVRWDDQVAGRFYLDGVSSGLTAVGGTGRTINLTASRPMTAKRLTYVQSRRWKIADSIVRGVNDIAALTFCEVPIEPADAQ